MAKTFVPALARNAEKMSVYISKHQSKMVGYDNGPTQAELNALQAALIPIAAMESKEQP